MFKIYPPVHQHITEQGHLRSNHKLGGYSSYSERIGSFDVKYLGIVITGNVSVDAGLTSTFWNKSLHSTESGWLTVMMDRMKWITSFKCNDRNSAFRLAHTIGETLHTLQDFYSHSDWVDGDAMLPIYVYYGDSTSLGLNYHTPRAHPVNIIDLETGGGAEFLGILYFDGGSDPTLDDAHNKYAADEAGFGRSRVPPGGIGMQAFNDAQRIAILSTRDFLDWSHDNMDYCCCQMLYSDPQNCRK